MKIATVFASLALACTARPSLAFITAARSCAFAV
jgi:hypothetical protein